MSMKPQWQKVALIITILSLIVLIGFLSYYILELNLTKEACWLWADSMTGPVSSFISKSFICSVL